MLYLIQSNQLESLFEELLDIRRQPPADILAPEEIVVQNTGMARWLSQRMARKTGIAANIDFPLPARFFWRIFNALAGGAGAETDNFDRDVLRWRILGLLPGLTEEHRFADLANYLAGDSEGFKSYQLAGVIADLYDRYLVFRPDMLREWEAGRGDEWQAELWRRLQTGELHRAGLLAETSRALRGSAETVPDLPGRSIFFGISSLPPSYLDILDLLAGTTDVFLLHLNPCRHYWTDLSSAAGLARKRAAWQHRGESDVSGYFERGNPLLASLGGVGQEFTRLLADMDYIEAERYVEPEGGTMLAAVQGDILDLRDRTAPEEEKIAIAGTDRSIQFHACHSRLREIQVLHDRLLAMFEGDPELKPGEVLVMAPDIEAYGPAIRAVFDSAAPHMHIPWSLADRQPGRAHSLAVIFLELLSLPSSRCTVPEVLAFLESPAVRRRFAMDEEEVQQARRWILGSGIRWGFDREHRLEHGLDMSAAHSWRYGLDRLFLGYFSGMETSFRGISAAGPVSGQDGGLLGRLAEFLGTLRRYSRLLRGRRTPAEWCSLLLRLLDDFFTSGDSEDDQEALEVLRDVLGAFQHDCGRAAFDGPLAFSVVREHFRQVLSLPAAGQAFLSGRVTFCNMVPMRSIPGKVICLLGMNDAEYPRNQFAASFDMMANQPRSGDRNRRRDDRYLFLESLMSARDILYVSWLGRDRQDNSPRPPSVVVGELLDYLNRGGRLEEDRPGLVTEHALQPFSRRCFDGPPETRSYAALWYPAADAPAMPSAFAAVPLASPGEEFRTVDVGGLAAFWSHPVRFFLQQRLGIRLWNEEDIVPENEPFQPDGLARYRLVDRLFNARMAGTSPEECCRILQAEGELPHGGFGFVTCREMLAAADDLALKVFPLLAAPREPLEVEVEVAGCLVTGWLAGIHDSGLVRWRPARLKGRDLLRLWVEHLVLNILAPDGCSLVSNHAATDTVARFSPVPEAPDILGRLVELYLEGLREPLPVFPESSLAWYEAAASGRDGMKAAWKSWQPGFRQQGEGEDQAYLIGLRGRQPFAGPFADMAAEVYEPLCRNLEK